MKTEKEIRDYIDAIKKRRDIDIETNKMIEILSWILDKK